MKKRTFLLLLISLFAASILVAGCGSDDDADNETPAAEEDQDNEGTDEPAGDAADGDVVELVVHATNWEFDKEVYEVPVGSTVELSIVSDEGFHGVEVEGYNVNVASNADPVTFEASEAGEFKMLCSIACGAGHDDMISTLVVN